MRIAVYPGSFDPITVGHIDIIQRISGVFEKVIVLVAHSNQKKYLFTPEERLKLVQASLPLGLSNIEVDIFEGLTVDYLKLKGARILVRGLRAVVDYEYELIMANMNRKLCPDVETMIVFSSPEFYYIASSTVKEVARYGGDINGLVPPPVVEPVLNKFRGRQS
jgi:pantetheine-phosphate adenylyltransferase